MAQEMMIDHVMCMMLYIYRVRIADCIYPSAGGPKDKLESQHGAASMMKK